METKTYSEKTKTVLDKIHKEFEKSMKTMVKAAENVIKGIIKRNKDNPDFTFKDFSFSDFQDSFHEYSELNRDKNLVEFMNNPHEYGVSTYSPIFINRISDENDRALYKAILECCKHDENNPDNRLFEDADEYIGGEFEFSSGRGVVVYFGVQPEINIEVLKKEVSAGAFNDETVKLFESLDYDLNKDIDIPLLDDEKKIIKNAMIACSYLEYCDKKDYRS